MKKRAVVLTAKQVKALELAWAVLYDGQTSTVQNGGDFQPRNDKKCKAAAEVINDLIIAAGYGEDDE